MFDIYIYIDIYIIEKLSDALNVSFMLMCIPEIFKPPGKSKE